MNDDAILKTTSAAAPPRPLRLAILQRVCTAYRLHLFRRLSGREDLKVRLFIGDDLPGTKVRSASNLEGVDLVRLSTTFLSLGRRVLPLHRGLLRALAQFQPDVILCEGESHLLGCLAAIWHRRRHPQVRLVHWSLGGLPGVKLRPWGLRARAKYLLQKRFDALVCYSSFGRDVMSRLGHPRQKLFVAVNVSDTERHLAAADRMIETSCEARAKLNLPDRFTVVYAGAMDRNKRLETLVDAAAALDRRQYNFVLLGDGGIREELRCHSQRLGLSNVFFPGRVGEELALYYRTGNVLALPGRGGMVISEAMAHGLPVVAFQADGTEHDLIQDGRTGLLLKKGDAEDFRQAIKFLQDNPQEAAAMGARAQDAVRNRFHLENLAEAVAGAVRAAYAGNPALGASRQQEESGYGRAA